MNNKARMQITVLAAISSGIMAFGVWKLAPRTQFQTVHSEDLEEVASELADRTKQPAIDSSQPAPEARSLQGLFGAHEGHQVQDWRFFLNEEQATKLYRLGPGRIYDPWTHYIEEPLRDMRVKQPGRPEGFYQLNTNAQGLRDRSLDGLQVGHASRPKHLVLWTGDSNSTGVCNLDENAASRIEQRFARRTPSVDLEVINAAVGGYGPHTYLGTLLKYAHLQPDVFVVAFFAGNDFNNALSFGRLFENHEHPDPWDTTSRNLRQRGKDEFPFLTGHFLNAIALFRDRPEIRTEALYKTLDVLLLARDFCEQHEIKMHVLYLPPPTSFPAAYKEPIIAKARKDLGLLERDFRMLSQLGTRLITELGANNIQVINARPHLVHLDPPPFWRNEMHYDTTAYEIFAELMEEPLAASLNLAQ